MVELTMNEQKKYATIKDEMLSYCLEYHLIMVFGTYCLPRSLLSSISLSFTLVLVVRLLPLLT